MKYLYNVIVRAKKIIKVLGYAYTGLLAANAVIEVLLEQMPDNKIKKLQKIFRYTSVGIDAIRKVLEWFGQNNIIADAERNAKEISSTDLNHLVRKEIKG